MGIKIDERALARLSDDERQAALADLAALEEAVEYCPLFKYNNPAFGPVHEKQLLGHASTDAIIAYFGGNRAGKTTFGIVDDLIQALPRESLPAHLLPYKKWEPPFYCRIIVPDFTGTLEGVIFHKIREWCPPHAFKGGNWDAAFDKQQRILHFACGSWFQFNTYDQDLNKLGGVALHRVHYDEEPPEDRRNECMMRLIDFNGDEVFTLTPSLSGGQGWMKRKVYDCRHDDGITVVTVDMDDNPNLSQEAKARLLAGLAPAELRARKCGEFVHFAGMVFDEEWSDDLVIPQIDKRTAQSEVVIVGIDPGIRFTGLVWIAFDKEDNAVLFHSAQLENHTVDRVCAHIREINNKWGVRPLYYVIDPSARNRVLTNAQAVESEFTAHGIHTAPGQNDLEAGVFQLKRRMLTRKLLVTASAENRGFIEEIENYRFDPKAIDKFAVIREKNHRLDACRYVCMSRPYVGTVRARVGRQKNPYGSLRYGVAPAFHGEPKHTSDNPYI